MICSDRCLLCLSKQTVKRRFSSERVNGFQEVHKRIPKHRLQQKMKKKNMCQYDSSTIEFRKDPFGLYGKKRKSLYVKIFFGLDLNQEEEALMDSSEFRLRGKYIRFECSFKLVLIPYEYILELNYIEIYNFSLLILFFLANNC